MQLKITEKDTQRAIIDYLSAKRIFNYRQNTGAFRNEKGGFYTFGAVGSPDIVAVWEGRYIGIEVKGPKGRLSPHQERFKGLLEAAGGYYLVARDLDDVIVFFTH